MASDLRAAVVQALLNDSSLQMIFGDRWYQFSAVPDEPPPERPYGVVKMGIENPLADWRSGPTDRMFQTWFHDKPGDYSRIDFAVERSKTVLELLPNSGQFVECRFLDASQDLEDPALGTILRYCRYQFAMSRGA